MGGPGSADPGRITYTRISLKYLIATAYGAEFDDRISGPPWIESEWYAVTATIPPGTNREQFRQMLVNLLAERFGLVFHGVTKEVPGYELTVGKGGAKIASLPSGLPMRPGTTASGPSRVDQQGFPVLASDHGWEGIGDEHGIDRYTFKQCSIARLADVLSIEYTRRRVPVIDRTGLSGEFSFHLEIPARAPPPPLRSDPGDVVSGGAGDPEADLSSISPALEKQLGLKLSAAKIKLQVMVIDRVARVPTAN